MPCSKHSTPKKSHMHRPSSTSSQYLHAPPRTPHAAHAVVGGGVGGSAADRPWARGGGAPEAACCVVPEQERVRVLHAAIDLGPVGANRHRPVRRGARRAGVRGQVGRSGVAAAGSGGGRGGGRGGFRPQQAQGRLAQREARPAAAVRGEPELLDVLPGHTRGQGGLRPLVRCAGATGRVLDRAACSPRFFPLGRSGPHRRTDLAAVQAGAHGKAQGREATPAQRRRAIHHWPLE